MTGDELITESMKDGIAELLTFIYREKSGGLSIHLTREPHRTENGQTEWQVAVTYRNDSKDAESKGAQGISGNLGDALFQVSVKIAKDVIES